MKTKTFILFILSGIFLSSCYREIDVEKFRTTPKIVINCPISPDTVIRASITHSYFYTDINHLRPNDNSWMYDQGKPNVKLRDAKVELYINDVYKEDMKWQALDSVDDYHAPDTFFVSTVIPKAGDKVKIVATADGYGSAWAEDIVPRLIPIEHLKITCRKENGQMNHDIGYDENGYTDYSSNEYYTFLYSITFKDTPGESNYYQLWVDGGSVNYYDPIFSTSGSTLDGALGYDGVDGRGGRVFTDDNIDGKEYTIQVKEQILTRYVTDTTRHWPSRTINLYALSEPYYQYLASLEKISASTLSGNLSDVGLAEPIRVYTNVNDGIGILGACQRININVNLWEYVPKEENNEEK